MKARATSAVHCVVVSAIILAITGFARPVAATQILKIWVTVYKELNNGESPSWSSKDQATEWAVRESARLEPIVLSIVRGERPDVQWIAGLAIAQAIPTPKMCAALREILRDTISHAPAGRIEPGSLDEGGLINIIDILVEAAPTGLPPFLRSLLAQEKQSSLIIEHCVNALRRVGGRDDVETLRQVSLRREDPFIDRLCALAEKAIEARLSGRDILRDADNELRAVTAKYLGALRSKDFAAYADAQPFAYRDVAKKEEVVREVFGNPQVEDVIRALAGVAGKEAFEIDRDNLEATLVVDGRYKFVYVLEVEGWKISGPTMIAP